MRRSLLAWPVLALISTSAMSILSYSAAFAMPLSRAVQIATEQDATVQSMRHEVSRGSTNIEIAKDGRRPQVSVGAATSSANGDAGLQLTVSQVLFDWGRVKAEIEAATEERAQLVADLKLAVEDLTLNIAELYIDLEIIDRKIAVSHEYMDFANRIAEQSAARVSAGLSNASEIARARLEIARANERMTQLASDRSITLTQIEFLVGRAIPSPNRAPTIPFAQRFASGSAAIAAVVLAPSYIIAKANVRIAEAGIDSARAKSRPTLKLQAEALQEVTGGRGRSTSIGLTAGVDLTASGFRGRAQTAAKQELAAAESRLLAVERDLQNKIRTYARSIDLLKANEASQREQVRQAQEVLSAYEEQFIGGRRELIDLLSTGRDLYDAQISEIETQQDLKMTEYQAAHAVGMLGSVIIEGKR